MVNEMDKEFSHIQMEYNMKGNLKMTNQMEKVY